MLNKLHIQSISTSQMQRVWGVLVRLFRREPPDACVITKTDISILASQGIREAPDGSAAFVHNTTRYVVFVLITALFEDLTRISPPNYYIFSYGLSGINMDRGGFGQAR
jgi:hypothetical protein